MWYAEHCVSCWQNPLYNNYNYCIQYRNENVYDTAMFWYKDDSGGNIDILGGDSISRHCEGKVHMNMCLILNGYWDTAVWIYKYKSSVNGNKHNSVLWQIVTQVMKFVTVHNKCSKNPTVDLTVLGNPCEKMAPCLSCVELYVSLCWQQRPKSERAIRLVSTCLLLTSFFISRSGETQSNGVRCGDWNSSFR